MRHRNPHRIHDPNNIFEVAENSSHPELYDSRRIYDYKGRRFKTAVEAEKYLTDHGINWKRRCKLVPVRQLDSDGHVIIVCHIAERVPAGHSDIRDIEKYMQNSMDRLRLG